MRVITGRGTKWILIPLLALALLGSSVQLREVNARDLREKAVSWVLRAVYEFAASKAVVPGRTMQQSKIKTQKPCSGSRFATLRPFTDAMLSADRPH